MESTESNRKSQKKRGRGPTGKSKAQFLEVYLHLGDVMEACRAVKIQHSQVHRWIGNDPEFARQFTEAEDQAGYALLSEARQRALHGSRELVKVKGVPYRDPKTGEFMYVRRNPSDRMLELLLKAQFPHKFRDNVGGGKDDDGVRVAGRGRANVIREEIEARQAVLAAIEKSQEGRDKSGN